MYNNSSVEFAERLYEALEAGGSRLSFFIGGAEGLPPSLKSDPRRRRRLMCANCDVSLLEDDLHVTHQMARRFCSWSRCEGPLQAMCFLHLQTRVYPPHLRTCAPQGSGLRTQTGPRHTVTTIVLYTEDSGSPPIG